MTQVDFYILEDDSPSGRELLFCRLVDKAWKQGHRIHVHTDSAAQTAQLDDLLWSFRDGSFLPHGVYQDDLTDPAPVLIHHDADPLYHADVLINMAAEVPLYFSRFRRIAEVINNDATTRRQGRSRYRFYKDRGYPLSTHTIAAARAV